MTGMFPGGAEMLSCGAWAATIAAVAITTDPLSRARSELWPALAQHAREDAIRATAIRVGAVRRIRRWLSVRHSLAVEAGSVLALYATYEATRGLVAGDRGIAVDHARAITSLERKLHVFMEPRVQDAARAVPHLLDILGGAYLILHLSVTAALLLWLHRRRPAAFALVRTTLLVASAIAVVGFIFFPTAPPRLAQVGLADTVSGRHVDLNKGLISSLYDPFAAVPSMHIGYAIVVAAVLVRSARTQIARIAGIVYPLFVLLVIVATGNHFLLDAAAGAIVGAAAWVVAAAITSTEAAAAWTESVRTAGPAPAVSTLQVRATAPRAKGELAA